MTFSFFSKRYYARKSTFLYLYFQGKVIRAVPEKVEKQLQTTKIENKMEKSKISEMANT